jgi:secretion/DNA translocation related TadE-like protein
MHNRNQLDRGSATGFAVTLLAGFSGLMGSVILLFSLASGQQSVQGAVDLAALVAADTQRGLISGSVCENAELILKSVDLAMTTCRIVGGGVMVKAQQELAFTRLRASAIAGARDI